MFQKILPKYLLVGSFVSCMSLVSAQLNIAQLGHLSYLTLHGSDLSNIWGYTDELGNEYALVGVNGANGQPNTGGLSVVNVTDPANPVEVFFTPGPNSIWREIKVYDNHAYVTTEAAAGLMIVDLSPLPQSTVLPVTTFLGLNWFTSHSLFIDETNGRLYLNGSNRGNGGVIFYDLTQDPEAPVEIGQFDDWYMHDCYARGNIMYGAHISDGFMSIVDVTDPANPVLLGTQPTPDNFTHNCWLDDSGQYIFTTDERPNSFLASYDVSDPTDIQFLDQLQTSPGSQAIIHNTYWLNDYVVQSYYTEGVSIYDVADPTNIIEVGRFDTSPFTGDGFNGAWGVYPFAPSGNLYVSDIEGGLFILGPSYVRGCYLQGAITEQGTGTAVGNATFTLSGTTASDVTGFDGLYSTGWGTAGTFSVLVQAPGYVDQTITGVILQNGEITLLDVQLVPLTSFAFSGTVLEQGTNAPVAGALVHVYNATYSFDATTGANGQFSIPSAFAGVYDITAGLWGYHTACISSLDVTEFTPGQTLFLAQGYADDFAIDLGWQVEGDATTGQWERGEPVGTIFGNTQSAPEVDVDGDCLDQCYVTGNGTTDPASDDVDNGFTQLTSPVFDATGTPDPWVRYYRWWFNAGGNGNMNDSLLIQLDNGVERVTIEEVTLADAGTHTWVMTQLSIAGLITPTANMRFIARAADSTPGHVVEAGLDRFELLPSAPVSVEENTASMQVRLYPDPSEGTFTVLAPGSTGNVRIFDAQGREAVQPVRLMNGEAEIHASLPSGLYLVRVTNTAGSVKTLRAVIR
jgi:choice-of-anchor B domain-containing protein